MKNNIINIVFILILCFFSNGIAQADIKIYDENGVYAPLDQVINNGRIYECFEQFKTNQCNFGSLYEPGIGIYWRNTWRVVTIGSNNNIIITNDSTENTKDFPGVPFIISTPKVTQSGSYIIEWEISDQSPSGKFVKLEENGEITNKVYGEDNSNIRFGSFSFSNMPNGNYLYAIYLCIQNDTIEKCSKSNTLLVKVDNSYDTDKVTIIKQEKIQEKKEAVKPSTLPEKDTIVKIYPGNKSSNIPTDYREKIEQKIQTIVQKNKLNTEKIGEIITNIESKLFILEVKNRKGLLSGSEKRNYFIYKMIKEIFETYL